MANKLTLQHKRSSVAGNLPTAATIAVGELAINFADKKLFTKDGANAIVELGNSKWTDQTGGVSRSDKIKVGAATAPLSAIDLLGTMSREPVATTGEMNLSFGDRFSITPAATTTFSITNVPAGRAVEVWLKVVNGGLQTINWSITGIVWESGSSPILAAAGTDIIVFATQDGGTTWFGHVMSSTATTTSASRLPASFNPATDLSVLIPIGDGLDFIIDDAVLSSPAPTATYPFRLQKVASDGVTAGSWMAMAPAAAGTPWFFSIKPNAAKTRYIIHVDENKTSAASSTIASATYIKLTVLSVANWANLYI